MGFNICLFRVKDGIAHELPSSQWTEGRANDGTWDSGRYGYDYDYYSDLHDDGVDWFDRTLWIQLAIEDDGYDPGTERMWRPSDACIAALKAKHPDNPRAQLIAAILESDPSIHVASL